MTTKSFWKEIKKPILGLSPMDGYSDSAFRRICKAIEPELVTVTEFTSADGLSYGATRLRKKLSFHSQEKPILAQIFGKNKETLIKATKICEDMGFTGIDINMGCPSKKVVKSEHGIALRKRPEEAFRLIEAVANNTSLPVSVKTRLGWKDAAGLIEFAKGVENAGANMICIHGRTYVEPYNVPAQYEPIYQLKEKITIPIIGNGGITSYEEAIEKSNGLDGVYIGQASFGNPWIFRKSGAPKTIKEKAPIIFKHAQWLIEDKGEVVGTREIRKHLLQYIKGFRGAKEFRRHIVHVQTYDDIHRVITEIIQSEKT